MYYATGTGEDCRVQAGKVEAGEREEAGRRQAGKVEVGEQDEAGKVVVGKRVGAGRGQAAR